MTVDKLLMPTASSVDFARAPFNNLPRRRRRACAAWRGALSTAQFSNSVIVGSYLIWFYPRKIESGLVIHKIHAKSGGTKLSDCKVEVKNFQKNLYISQHLGINCYVNFLGHLGCDGFQLKWMFGTHGNWKKKKILFIYLKGKLIAPKTILVFLFPFCRISRKFRSWFDSIQTASCEKNLLRNVVSPYSRLK